MMMMQMERRTRTTSNLHFHVIYFTKITRNKVVEVKPLYSWCLQPRSHDNKKSEQSRCLRAGQRPSGRYITDTGISRLNMYEARTGHSPRLRASYNTGVESKSAEAAVIKGRLAQCLFCLLLIQLVNNM